MGIVFIGGGGEGRGGGGSRRIWVFFVFICS